MSITLAIGTTLKIASTLAAAKTMSAVSNAFPAVATLEASHGVVVGDKIHIRSGWELLDHVFARVSAVSTNDVTLEGIDTRDTDLFPAGSGTGTVREVTAFTEVTQITRDYTVSGGEQQFVDISTLKNRQDKEMPVNRSVINNLFPLFEDRSLAHYAAIDGADSVETAGEITYPNGSRTLFTGFWTIGKVATVQDKTLRNAVSLRYASDPLSYAT